MSYIRVRSFEILRATAVRTIVYYCAVVVSLVLYDVKNKKNKKIYILKIRENEDDDDDDGQDDYTRFV